MSEMWKKLTGMEGHAQVLTEPDGSVPVLFAQRVSRVLTTALLLAALVWLDQCLGPSSFLLRRSGTGMLLAAVAVAAFRKPNSSRYFAGALATVAAVILVSLAPTVPLALVGFVCAVALIESAGAAGLARIPTGFAHACLSYVAIRFAFDLVPQHRLLDDAISKLVASELQWTTGRTQNLSPTAVGGSAILMAVLFLMWRWRLAGSSARLWAALAVPIAWFSLLPLVTAPSSAGAWAAFVRGAIHGTTWLCFSVVLDSALPHRDYPSRTFSERRTGLILSALAGASFCAGVCLVGTSFLLPPAGRTIVVHNRGGLDWERPVFGRFGAFSGGMFGLLPVYARANGYNFDVVDKDTITASDLEQAQVLVLINSPTIWAGDERRAVLDFVARGGGLLVLGDHTDVFGLMKGFNSLLNEFGVLFRFDSAYHARETWRGCLVAAPDALCSRWDEESPGVAIGASLQLGMSARPLLVGRYSHSDSGVRHNIVGSYLGNYRYDEGERLGDLALVATAVHGRGRVVVWGDTSSFQGGLSYTFPRVIGPLLELLSRPPSATERPAVRRAAAIVLLTSIVWLGAIRTKASWAGAVSASLLAGIAATWCASLQQIHTPVHVAKDTFLIDSSHLPAVGHYEAKVNPSGPIYTNLLRSGFRVAEHEKWEPAAIARARGIAFIAPRKPFTDREIDDLLGAEDVGAVVILAVGQPDSAGAAKLLAAHGLRLSARPLGTIPPGSISGGRRERERPRFIDAWPIVTTTGGDPAADPRVATIYRAGKDVTALFRRQGRGGLLLFSDSRFFSSMNIEDVTGYWLGNLALVHDVFQVYLGAQPDAVRPLFKSPEKPD